jgi:hypothetical protein
MLNIEAFRELCRRAAIETDPTALQRIKDALRLMLRVKQIELCCRKETRPEIKLRTQVVLSVCALFLRTRRRCAV